MGEKERKRRDKLIQVATRDIIESLPRPAIRGRGFERYFFFSFLTIFRSDIFHVRLRRNYLLVVYTYVTAESVKFF